MLAVRQTMAGGIDVEAVEGGRGRGGKVKEWYLRMEEKSVQNRGQLKVCARTCSDLLL